MDSRPEPTGSAPSPGGRGAGNHNRKEQEMSLKLKALGLSLMAAVAVSAVGVMNASATTGGHFVSDLVHTNIKGTEGGSHRHHFSETGFAGEIGCDVATYTATTAAATVTSLTVTPKYEKCYTTPGPWTVENDIPVTVNGCTYTFTVAPGAPATTEHTVHLLCPEGKKIEIHHPNCTISIHPQTPTGKITYTTATNAVTGKHEITLDTDVEFTVTRHGLCQFIKPTTGTGRLLGSATVAGFNPNGGAQVGITST
jgi:hypothetical protein